MNSFTVASKDVGMCEFTVSQRMLKNFQTKISINTLHVKWSFHSLSYFPIIY